MKKNMVKSLVFGLLVFVFISMSSLLAHAKEKKVIEMKLGYWVSPGSLEDKMYRAFANEVEERTNGGIHITLYPGAALGSIKTHFELLKSGSIQLCMFYPMFFPGKYPLFDMFQLPWLTDDPMIHTLAMNNLVKRGLLDKSYYKEFHGLAHYVVGYTLLAMRKHEIKRPQDAKGIKIRSSGGPTTKMLKAVGAKVVSVTFPETYSALQRGVVAGAFTDWHALIDAKFLDFVRYVCDLRCYQTTANLVMNKDAYENLSDDYKKIMDEAALHSVPSLLQDTAFRTKQAQNILVSKGGQVYYPTPEEMQLWKDGFMFVWEDWISDMKSKGLDGEALLHEYGEAVKSFGGNWPYKY